jgi:hypothetical protein
MSTTSTITPKNSENHRQPRKMSEPVERSRLLPAVSWTVSPTWILVVGAVTATAATLAGS